jgi:glycine oxidase
MLAPNGELLPGEWWTRLAFDSLNTYPEWVAQLERASGRPIDFRICGAREFRGGTVREFPEEAIVDPRDLTAALAALVPVRTGAKVTGWDEGPDGVTVLGIRARALVVSAGAWSGLLPGLPPTEPVRGHLLAYAMSPGSLGPILRRGPTYILQRRNGITLVGSTEQRVGFDRAMDAAALAELALRGAALWPELGGRKADDAWLGFRPATPSGVPAMGRMKGRPVWLAYGHFRNGILLAPKVAGLLAAEIDGALSRG